jgi:hypothetical protein
MNILGSELAIPGGTFIHIDITQLPVLFLLDYLQKPKRRPTTSSHTGRSSVPDKSQRRSTSFSPDRVRVRGRSPAFNALAANFENSNVRNLSTPPPIARKPFSKSSPDPVKPPQRAASIAAMSATFERPRQTLIPKSIKGMLTYSARSRYLWHWKRSSLTCWVLLMYSEY